MGKGDGWPYQESQSGDQLPNYPFPPFHRHKRRVCFLSSWSYQKQTNKQKQENPSNYLSQILTIIKANLFLENQFQHIHTEVAQNEENMKVRDLTCNLIANCLEPLTPVYLSINEGFQLENL